MNRTLLSLIIAAVTIALLGTGCATKPGKKQTEQVLRDSGFRPVKAVTDAQKQQLQSLRPGQISSVHRNGKTYYIFPDRPHDTLYVGGEAEYKSYQFLAPTYQEMAADGQGFKAAEHDGHFPGWDEVWGND